MKLTYESDRPVALKGILTLLQKRMGLEFIAETCLQCLPYALLWKFKLGEGKEMWDYEAWKSSLDLAPSWSSSFRGGTLYAGPPGRKDLNVEIIQQMRVEKSDENTSATLHLSGKYHGPLQLRGCAKDHRRITLRQKRFWREFDILIDCDLAWEGTISVVLVLVLTDRNEYPAGKSFGLILSQGFHEERTWQRVGIFRVYHSDSRVARFDPGARVTALFSQEGEFAVR